MNTSEESSKKQPVALVTGANQGVGYQVAKALAEHGYLVYLGARSFSKGEKAAAEMGKNAHVIEIDVTQQSTIDKAVQRIQAEQGHLDLLVNNAGISNAGEPGRSLEEVVAANRASTASLAEIKKVWDTNVFGVIAVTQAMLPLLRKAPAARIVNVSSALGSLSWIADPSTWARQHYDVAYAASKAAMNAVTMAFALELENENIKVNAVSPGFTATALNNFQGTDSPEVGSREPIRVALDTEGPTMTFTGPEGALQW